MKIIKISLVVLLFSFCSCEEYIYKKLLQNAPTYEIFGDIY